MDLNLFRYLNRSHQGLENIFGTHYHIETLFVSYFGFLFTALNILYTFLIEFCELGFAQTFNNLFSLLRVEGNAIFYATIKL